MKKAYLFFATLFAAFTIVVLTMQNSFTYSLAAPFGNTGSTGDGANNTCAKGGCHVGTVNSGPGSISIDLSDIPSAGWRAGKTYKVRVVVAEGSKTNYGFQLTAENASDHSKAGNFSTGGNNNVVLANFDWITHKSTSGSGDWTFDWTAPTTGGEIIFYAAGNAANGNGTASGDRIYTTNKAVQKDPASGLTAYESKENGLIFENPVTDELKIQSKEERQIAVFNLSGSKMTTANIQNEQHNIDVSSWERGMYLMVDEGTGKTYRVILK